MSGIQGLPHLKVALYGFTNIFDDFPASVQVIEGTPSKVESEINAAAVTFAAVSIERV